MFNNSWYYSAADLQMLPGNWKVLFLLCQRKLKFTMPRRPWTNTCRWSCSLIAYESLYNGIFTVQWWSWHNSIFISVAITIWIIVQWYIHGTMVVIGTIVYLLVLQSRDEWWHIFFSKSFSEQPFVTHFSPKFVFQQFNSWTFFFLIWNFSARWRIIN